MKTAQAYVPKFTFVLNKLFQIHVLSKVLLHNRQDFVNFDQVLGII